MEEILAENNHKILEAQRKLVRMANPCGQNEYISFTAEYIFVFRVCVLASPEHSYKQPFFPTQHCYSQRLAHICIDQM